MLGTMNHQQAAALLFIIITMCLSSPDCATAFTVSLPLPFSLPRSSSSHARTTTRTRTALGITSDEILANARRAAGLPPEEEKQPMLYNDDLLDDFQQALLTLEKRVKQGPGSLSILEVEEFSGQVQRILNEARENPDKRLPRPAKTKTTGDGVEEAVSVAAPPAPAASVSSASARPQPPSPAPQPAERQQQASAVASVSSGSSILDKSLDEGPVYDGRGGMGQPKGTVNTYVIEGMDEMSVDEYRAALQESVLERQRQRKSSGVATGNRATWDYLNQLTAKGDDGVLSKGGKKNNNKNSNKNYGPSGSGGGGGSD